MFGRVGSPFGKVFLLGNFKQISKHILQNLQLEINHKDSYLFKNHYKTTYMDLILMNQPRSFNLFLYLTLDFLIYIGLLLRYWRHVL